MTILPTNKNPLASIINPLTSLNTNYSDLIGLMQLLNANNQANQQPRTANIGGMNILDVTQRGGLNALPQALTTLATGMAGMEQNKNKNSFLKGVQEITKSGKSPDDKINDLVGLVAEHGTDYDLGVMDIVKQYGQMANRSTLGSIGKNIPEGYEIIGYDQKGQPMIRKKKGITVADKKFAMEQKEKKQKKDLESQMVKDSAQDTINTIAEIKKGIQYFGAAGEMIPPLPMEYSKKNWSANVDKLKSKLVVDLMNKMKQASRTGATGFGQLSDKERELLQNAATALQKGLSEGDASKYLDEIEQGAMKILGKGTTSGNKTLDKQTAAQFFKQAGGNKQKARALAKQAGFSF